MEIIEEYSGRWDSILIRAGLDAKYFTGKHQKCGLCGQGKDCFRWVKAPKEFWYCTKCGVKNGIDAYMSFTGLTFRESCNEIRGNKVKYKKTEYKEVDPAIRLKRIHSRLSNLTDGDGVDQYLKSRGLERLSSEIFIGELPYYGGGKVPGVFTTMVSRISNLDGELEAYHLTYLKDGKKITDHPAKIITKPVTTITGCSVKLGEPQKILAIAEGIETAIAVQAHEGVVCWAAISANGMEKIEVPARIETVFIYGDNDANYVGQAAAYNLAKRMSAAGKAVLVFIPDKAGEDYLDVFTR